MPILPTNQNGLAAAYPYRASSSQAILELIKHFAIMNTGQVRAAWFLTTAVTDFDEGSSIVNGLGYRVGSLLGLVE